MDTTDHNDWSQTAMVGLSRWRITIQRIHSRVNISASGLHLMRARLVVSEYVTWLGPGVMAPR